MARTRRVSRPLISNAPPGVVITRIEVPIRTIARIVLALTALYLLFILRDKVLVFFIAILLSLALEPLMLRLERRGWSRGRTVLGLLASGALALGVLGAVLIPSVIEDGDDLAESLPSYVEDAKGLLERYPEVQEWLQSRADEGSANPSGLFSGVLSFGAGFFSGVANLFILAALTIYLLLDGPRLFQWMCQGLSPSARTRAERIRQEVSSVVGAYVRGQSINSLLFGVFTFIVLSVAGAPQALLIAILAAFLDAVPLIGASLATIPAVLLSLTVSFPTAVVVLALFVGYQLLENYVIAPRVFRGTLQISALAVLIAVTVGSALLGVVGALLALPVAAAIPAIARVWHEDPPGHPIAPWPIPFFSDEPPNRDLSDS